MKRIVLGIGIIWSCALNAQEQCIDNQELQQLIEVMVEDGALEDVDFATLLDDLERLQQTPIDLNECTQERLEQLPFLSPMQAAAIVSHRKNAGRFISFLELQGVDGMDLVTLRVMRSVAMVSGDLNRRQLTWQGLQDDGKLEAFIRGQRVLEAQEGYQSSTDNGYLGDPFRILSRVRFRYYDALSIGVTMEKDPGEAFFGPQQPHGFDFYSGHLALGKQGVLDRLIVGDYQAQFGQGLVVWSGMAFGKSGNVLTAKRNARGLLPYVSADENNFLRGAAISLRRGALQSSTFVSRLARDASVSDSALANGRKVFGAFQRTGIHATESQLKAKDAIYLQTLGQHFRYTRDHLQIGLSLQTTWHNGSQALPNQVYRQYDVVPTQLTVGGMDYQWSHRNLMAFGEWAVRGDGRRAWLNGLICSLGSQVDASLLHRKYDLGFHHELSNAFGEASRVSNEEGLFLGAAMRLNRRWKLSGYSDIYRFPWLRFRSDGPSDGTEYWLQVDYKPQRHVSIYARFRLEERSQNVQREGQSTALILPMNRRNIRLHAAYNLNDQIALRNRLEWVWVDQSGLLEEQGLLIYQDLIWKPKWPKPYQLKFRYALFDTDGFDSRIYAYEHDLRYSFSIPAFFDRGSRFYVFLGYRFSDWGKMNLRFAQTFYSNRTSIGSGLNTIDGASVTDLRLQLEFKL